MLGKAQKEPRECQSLGALCCYGTLWAVYEYQGLDILVSSSPDLPCESVYRCSVQEEPFPTASDLVLSLVLEHLGLGHPDW